MTVERRDLDRSPLPARDLARFDAIVFDPPRAGADAQSREIAASAVPCVVGVSCNPVTFARDARTLVDGGYRLTGVVPVDQFLWSTHVELVGTFVR
jgi:23S rRNA (uracil1939-C5)-methyltransferase